MLVVYITSTKLIHLGAAIINFRLFIGGLGLVAWEGDVNGKAEGSKVQADEKVAIPLSGVVAAALAIVFTSYGGGSLEGSAYLTHAIWTASHTSRIRSIIHSHM